nr:hypothetical protein GCM10020092_021430 [Actinoplanes digitatis]
MNPAGTMWSAAWIALPVFGLLLVGLLTDVKLPFNLPIGLVALLVGSAIGWIGGAMSVPDVTAAAKDIAFAFPHLKVDLLIDGLRDMAPLLATAIPLGVYNFTEAMTNVESAASAGDRYNLRSVLLADGGGAVVGSMLGSPFPLGRVRRPPRLEGGGRPHRLLDGHRRRHRPALLLRDVRAAGHPLPDRGDRPDPALHRPAHRRTGVPGHAAGARRGRGRRPHPQHRELGDRPDGQRPGGGGYLGGRGGRQHPGRRGRRLRRPEDARRGRDPG